MQRLTQLRASVSQSKTAADATAAFLSNQLDRLDRLLSDNGNARRVGRVQSQAQAEAYMMRMDRYRAGPANIEFCFPDYFFACVSKPQRCGWTDTAQVPPILPV